MIADDTSRVVYVSVDGGMGSGMLISIIILLYFDDESVDLVVMRVVAALEQRLGSRIYTEENICISGTHTHGVIHKPKLFTFLTHLI